MSLNVHCSHYKKAFCFLLGSNVGASPGSSNTNTAGNVALTRGGPYAYPSSVVVPYNAQYGGVAVQQPGVSQYGGANVALSQGGPYPYPSSVAVPYSAPSGGVAVQQPGFSHAAQSVAAPYTGSSYSAPAQAGGSTAGSAQTGATSKPAAGT